MNKPDALTTAALQKEDYRDFSHTGPNTLAGRYMRMFWQPVFVAEKLTSGRTVPIQIMNETFTLYRGEGGTPRIVQSHCPHRGTLLSTGWVEGDDIRCFYHGWKFDGSGQCVEQPAEEKHFAKNIKIRTYPTREYLGLIFAYFGEGEAPPFPLYTDLEADLGPKVVFRVNEYTRMCNYFNNLENGVDPVHVAFVHHNTFKDSPLWGKELVTAQETKWGFSIRGERPDGDIRLYHAFMPNALLLKIKIDVPEIEWSDQIAWRVPVDDFHHRSFGVSQIHFSTEEAAHQYKEKLNVATERKPDAYELTKRILKGDLHCDDLDPKEVDLIDIQDQVAQIGQGVIAPRENDRLGRSDAAVSLLRRLWARELQALAEGRALTQWEHPETILNLCRV